MKSSSPATLTSLLCLATRGQNRPQTISAVVSGMCGPEQITRRDGTTAMVSTLQLSDATQPMGLELRLWGAQSVQVIPLRPLDIVQVVHLTAQCNPPHEPSLRFRYDSLLQRHPNPPVSLSVWRDAHFAPLIPLANRAAIRSRDWPASCSPPPLRAPSPPNAAPTLHCVASGRCESPVELSVRFIRVHIRALCDAPSLQKVVRVCRCGGSSCICGEQWRFGRVGVELRDESGEAAAWLGGSALSNLLGLSAARVMADVAVAEWGMRALACLTQETTIRVLIKVEDMNKPLSLMRVFL